MLEVARICRVGLCVEDPGDARRVSNFIATEMTDELDEKLKDAMVQSTALRRFGNTDEIANVAIFLASDMSSYITGETLNTSGGMF